MINYSMLVELGEELEVVLSNNKIKNMECIIRLPSFQIRKLDEDIYIRTNLANSENLSEEEKKEIGNYKSEVNELFLNFNNVLIHIMAKEE